VDHKVATTGVKTFRYRDHVYSSAGPVEGRIIGLNRDQKTIDVDRLPNIKPGDRIRINPGGRAHNYEIEAVEGLGEGRLRLTLDVTSLIGRSPIESVEGQRIELTMHIMTRTGNLEQTRLQLEGNGVWASIEKAYNTMPGRGSTSIQVDDISKLGDLKPGRWVQVVDYVIGDRVVFEPTVGA
jgi:hypothetical protein